MSSCLRRIAALWIGSAVAFGVSANAHHSVTGAFDSEDPFEMTGTIREVEWVNPHVYIYLDVTNQDGSVTRWALETAPTSMFRNGGISKSMLEGDGNPVTITGIRARDKSLEAGWVNRITYSDGHFYDISSTGR